MPLRSPSVPRPGKEGKFAWEMYDYGELLPKRFGPTPRSVSPGPIYNPPSSFGTGGISFGRRHKPVGIPESPGPGKYSVENGGIGSNPYNKVSMKGRAKDYTSVTRSPGPAGYSLLNHDTVGSDKTRGIAFKGKREPPKVSVSPGPGTYEIKSIDFEEGKVSTKAATFKGHTNEMKIPDSPGPGAYSLRSSIGSSPSRAASLKGRDYWGSAANDSPGPAQYSPTDISRKRAPAYTLRPKTKDISNASVVDRSPGPAAYAIPTTMGGGPRKSLSSRHRDQTQRERSPGPAAYGPGVSAINKSRAASLKGRHRDLTVIERSPGPGAYGVPGTMGQGLAASLKSRPIDRSESHSPGPAFEWTGDGIAGISSDPKKGKTISGRHNLDKMCPIHFPTEVSKGIRCLCTPGPGEYYHRNDEVGSSVRKKGSNVKGPTMKGRHPAVSDHCSPGPGAYALKSSIGTGSGAVGFTSPTNTDAVQRYLQQGSAAKKSGTRGMRAEPGADTTIYVP